MFRMRGVQRSAGVKRMGSAFFSASLILSSFPFFPHDDTYSFYDEHFRIDFRLDFRGGSPNDGPF